MVSARQLYRQVKKELEQAGVPDAALEAGLLVEGATGFSRFDHEEVPVAKAEKLAGFVRRRLAREPLQYILGQWPFMGLQLAVGPGVLAPRPETEEVCLAAIECIKDAPAPEVLDLCAGTGALALGIAVNVPDARARAVELEDAAFAWLQKNTRTTPVEAVQADALCYYKELQDESLDLLVANPPYVTKEEYESLAPELYHEPRSALVAPHEGLLFYEEIAKHYKAKLKPRAHLVFEIGAGQGDAVRGILTQNGYNAIEIRKDINGCARIALAAR